MRRTIQEGRVLLPDLVLLIDQTLLDLIRILLLAIAVISFGRRRRYYGSVCIRDSYLGSPPLLAEPLVPQLRFWAAFDARKQMTRTARVCLSASELTKHGCDC